MVFLRAVRGIIFQPATIPSLPLERPPILNSCHWAAPEEGLCNALHLLGLHGAPIDVMGASNRLRGNLGCGSFRPSPDSASSKRKLFQVISGTRDSRAMIKAATVDI
jgi:hypothetical protein